MNETTTDTEKEYTETALKAKIVAIKRLQELVEKKSTSISTNELEACRELLHL